MDITRDARILHRVEHPICATDKTHGLGPQRGARRHPADQGRPRRPRADGHLRPLSPSPGRGPPGYPIGGIRHSIVVSMRKFDSCVCRSAKKKSSAPKTITATKQQSAIDYNVFEGQKVKGLPRFTLTRGHVAIHDGEVRTQEGHGQFVRREPFTAVNKALSTWKELVAPRKVERTGIPATGV